jgi:hypothetical protein
MEYVHNDVLLYDLPALDVLQQGLLYLRTNQVLNYGGKSLSIALITHQ